jgi:hypothetical protein
MAGVYEKGPTRIVGHQHFSTRFLDTHREMSTWYYQSAGPVSKNRLIFDIIRSARPQDSDVLLLNVRSHLHKWANPGMQADAGALW